MVDDIEALLDKLHADEAVHQRMAMITAAPTSYHRVAARNLSRLSDWQDTVQRDYPPRAPRPLIPLVNLDVLERGEDAGGANRKDRTIKNHRAFRVRSVIDAHAWKRKPPERFSNVGESALVAATPTKNFTWPSYGIFLSKTLITTSY